MADERQIEPQALATTLEQAKLHLDQAVAHVRDPSIRPLRGARALDDNNTTCNTGCTCGAPPQLSGIVERGSGG